MFFIFLIMILTILSLEISCNWDFLNKNTKIIITTCSIIINIFLIFITILAFNTNKKEFLIKTEQLYALQVNNNISGNFLLGCGTINGVQKVTYATKNKDDNISINSININKKVTFKENNERILKIYKIKFENPIIEWWFDFGSNQNERYEFNVPKGSITTDFNIDLK